ncbi:hypothetical protein AC244_13590 [Ensifer adhaerens]|uniref:Uncharacterized protein n=1 Tax=Ensifer adhaerens TaxID=106592 RepID=A0A0L8BUL7_ENSAD|nr:hypothetical protein [Ensifer adhaerens]KOF18407.1 hypothetical protein AC244_13590 [Ensifer adhaerens]
MRKTGGRFISNTERHATADRNGARLVADDVGNATSISWCQWPHPVTLDGKMPSIKAKCWWPPARQAMRASSLPVVNLTIWKLMRRRHKVSVRWMKARFGMKSSIRSLKSSTQKPGLVRGLMEGEISVATIKPVQI